MPKGYVIGRAKVSDATKWASYAAKASEVIKQYGGTPVVRGGQIGFGPIPGPHDADDRDDGDEHEQDAHEEAGIPPGGSLQARGEGGGGSRVIGHGMVLRSVGAGQARPGSPGRRGDASPCPAS